MPLFRFRLPSGRLVTITSCPSIVAPLIPENAGVLDDNVCDTLSVTDVNASFSELRIRMSSSSISPASFGPPPVILASLRLQSTRAFAEPLRLFHFFFTSFTYRLFPWMELMFFITLFHNLVFFLFISAL